MTQQSAWSIGGRLGYVIGCCTMWFASAGYTNAHFDADYVFPPGISAELGNFGGWFAGLGAETRLSEHVALRFELRHAEFQDKVFIRDEITPAESRISTLNPVWARVPDLSAQLTGRVPDECERPLGPVETSALERV